MKKNKIFRILLDIAMITIMIILMGYYITDNKIHELLGISLFILFIIHNLLNIKWYKTIVKGKYSIQRNIHITVNLLLLVAMIGMMISSIMIGTDIFDFVNISSILLGRRLHMLFNSWLFILVVIHIGIHLKGFITKISNKMKNSAFEYVYYLFLFLLFCFGIYAFITNGLWKDMFLLNEYKYFDYDKHYIIFYLEYLSMIFSILIITYYTLMIISKIKNERNEIK